MSHITRNAKSLISERRTMKTPTFFALNKPCPKEPLTSLDPKPPDQLRPTRLFELTAKYLFYTYY